MSKDIARLHDMLNWARKAVQYAQSTSQTEFLETPMLQDACVRCLEVVGEAVSHVSEEFRDQYPSIPWRRAKGMRNILIHEYGAVDYGIVHETIVVFLPELIAHVEHALGVVSP
jgi:uncharacterized protein with HEPN domain